MWNMKRYVIAVTTGATEIVTIGLKTYRNNTMKAAVTGTSHIIRKVVECKTSSLSGGVNH
jgi:hypothetical protein